MRESLSIEASVAETELNDLLTLIERGEEIVLTRQGEPIATLSQVKKQLKPFKSRAELRAGQPMSKTSSVDTLIALRDEARY